MKIQICKNFPKSNKLQKKLSKAFPDDTIFIKSCIGMCKLCQKQPTVKVKGKKQKAKRISKLIAKIDAL